MSQLPFRVAAATLLVSGATLAQPAPQHVFILAGQSNMVALDPATSFTPTVAREFGEKSVIVIKDAENSAPIRRWYKGWTAAPGDSVGLLGDLYDRLMAKVKPAIEGKRIESVTFIWMQGARDANEKRGAQYGGALRGLIDQLARDLQRPDMTVVVWRLNDYNMTDADWRRVRDAQVAVGESNPRFGWVDSDDLNGADNALHFSRPALDTLGQRLAAKAIALINRNKK
jgi:hypothetical protein